MPWRARLAWIWTLVVLALCWIPRFYLPVDEHASRPFFVPNFDKLVHLGIFAVFAILWMRVAPSNRRALGILLVGAALAVITELGQNTRFVNRDGNAADAIADVLGVFAGLAGFAAVQRFLRERAGRPEV